MMQLVREKIVAIKRSAASIFKFAVAFPLAYFGGNVVFGILAVGSWLPELLSAILKPGVFDVTMVVLLWIIRIIVFIILLHIFLPTVFEKTSSMRKKSNV